MIKTDLSFDFVEIKKGRRVDAIRFDILKNNPDESLSNNPNTEIVDDIIQNTKLKKNAQGVSLTANVQNLKIDIEKIVGDEIKPKALQYLLDKSTIDNIKLYLDNWSKFTPSKNPIGFFIKACTENYTIPKTINNKPIQSTNYKQREYDDEFFDSLYNNLEYIKDDDGKIRT